MKQTVTNCHGTGVVTVVYEQRLYRVSSQTTADNFGTDCVKTNENDIKDALTSRLDDAADSLF